MRKVGHFFRALLYEVASSCGIAKIKACLMALFTRSNTIHFASSFGIFMTLQEQRHLHAVHCHNDDVDNVYMF